MLEHDDDTAINEARLWKDNGWTARVIKNEDDDGWAVAMTRDGEREPALVGPWTMGRDKKNPKPLDTAAFNTLVKTAHEVVRRHESLRTTFALVDEEPVQVIAPPAPLPLPLIDLSGLAAPAAQALATAYRRGNLGRLTVEKADGAALLGSGSTPLREALQEAGFVATPRGLRLRA